MRDQVSRRKKEEILECSGIFASLRFKSQEFIVYSSSNEISDSSSLSKFSTVRDRFGRNLLRLRMTNTAEMTRTVNASKQLTHIQVDEEEDSGWDSGEVVPDTEFSSDLDSLEIVGAGVEWPDIGDEVKWLTGTSVGEFVCGFG